MENQLYLPGRHSACRTILLFFFFCALGSFLSIPHAQAQLQGNYTIGSDGHYSTISEAVAALTTEGISGPVTFSVQPGTYEEQISINEFAGNSCDNPVIFEGTGTSRAEVVLQSPSGSDFTIQVNGTDGIGFRHMAIVGTIEVNAGSDCFSLEDNILRGSVQATSSASERNNGHRYRNNLFQTGSLIIENEAPWNPEAPVFDEGLLIEGNEVTAISVNGQQGYSILDNEVSVSGQQGIGIEVRNSWYGHEISGNNISANIDNYQGAGMVLRSAAAARIMANSIGVTDGGIAMSITTGKSLEDEILIANNQLTTDGYDARGIFYKPISNLVGLSISNEHINTVKIYHNTIQVVGYSEYVSNYALGISGAANSYHILNNAIINYAYGWAVIANDPSAIAEMDYNNIVADSDDFGRWGGQEASSLAEWQSLTGFDEHSIEAGLGFPHEDYVGAGIYLEEVPRDYYGHERNDPPTIGAVETAPTRTPLSGIYTIGGEDPDFATFREALSALNDSGIEDSVVFRVRPGEYTEQLSLGTYGLDAGIIFEGESGDSTDVTLRYPLEDAAIVLNGTSNFSLRHITVMSGIQASGGRNMLLESNVIHGGVSASMHSGAIYRHNLFLEQGISKSGEGVVEQQGRYFFNTDVGVVIEENTFRVAGSAIYLTAQEDIVITGNHITIEGDEPTTVRPAVRVYSNLDIQELSNNTIVSHVSNTTGLSLGGIYFASDLPRDISNNRIELLNGGTGISVSSGGSSPSVVMKNNMIAINANNPSTGISLSDTPGQIYLYHNSVLVYGADSSSRAMYFGDGIDREVHLQNNLFANQTGGPVFAGEDFEDSEDKISSSDFNNLYTSGEVLAYWEDGAIATLSEWQALTGFDQNSIAVDPQFESEEMLIPANPALAGAGSWLEAVPTDFFGNQRTDPPSIGAVEIEEDGEVPVALTPIVECVVRNPDGSLTATFGYHNPAQENVQLPVGSENFLDLMEYAGQPDSFAPGRHEAVFHVVFETSQSLSWTLGDTTVTVDTDMPACDSPLQPVAPLAGCVTEINRTLSLASLGYHNPNDAPVAIASGRLNRMSGRQDQGQPTVFEPGLHEEVFAASYSGALMWTLGRERAMVNRNTPACSPALQAVQPLLDCVSDNGDGTYTAHFGYHNPNAMPVSAGYMLHNQLLPAFPGMDERPLSFEPGRHERVFSVPFRGQRLQWKLMGSTVTATRAAELNCENAEAARTASLEEEPFGGGIGTEVYPNPFSRTVQLKLPDADSQTINIRIFSLSSGMLLMEENRSAGRSDIQLDLEQLEAGAYILEVKTGEVTERIRIMKH